MKFFKSKDEEGNEVFVPDVPVATEEQLFVIEVKSVVRTKKPKIETKYKDVVSGQIKHHQWDREEGKEYQEITLFNGEFEYSDKSEQIFRQEKTNLDISDLVLYINRAR